MNYTANLNLKLPEYTDPVDVEDFNSNFTAIDQGIEDATSRTHTLSSTADGWQENDGVFTQTFSVDGITDEIQMSGCVYAADTDEKNYDEKRAIVDALGCINEIVTEDGTITLICYDSAPEVDMDIIVTEIK